MKSKITISFFLSGILILLASNTNPDPPPQLGQYIIIGWNDLGMHCANKDFSLLAVLPPYNNLKAHLIQRGDETNLPVVMTTGFQVTYEIPGNTFSVGKTNFWDYEDQLFGVNLPDNTGLTGAVLSGNMQITDNHFRIEGIPVTPFTDANLLQEDPYQLTLLQAYDGQNNLLATTQPVIPVSNEISCVSSGCHFNETAILYQHENEGGFDPTDTPILCAVCHSSNALGTPGTPGLGSFSEVIHLRHSSETNDCYKCHPGIITQCFRGIMNQIGLVCQDCHGSVYNVGLTAQNGRQPWLEEPSCGAVSCHGPNYSEEPGLLFRQSKGHGGLFCSTCHGSPHAIQPGNSRDNAQNIALQGFSGTLRRCEICHGIVPSAPGPHGILPPSTVTQTDLKIWLEGPFNQTLMNTSLNAGTQLPLSQPYNTDPWNYAGSESVDPIPGSNVVDWVLVELRESEGDASTATFDRIIARRAGFLLNDGQIVDLDGISPLEFQVPVYVNLYAVVRHRNHIGIMSAQPLVLVNDMYTCDYTTGPDKVFGGLTGYKELSAGVYGMVGGDADADGIVQASDITVSWSEQAGGAGYQTADFDMDIQVNNPDKNDIWVHNSGTGSQVLQLKTAAAYICCIPE